MAKIDWNVYDFPGATSGAISLLELVCTIFYPTEIQAMSRRKTVRELQRQLQYAQRREAYVAPERSAGSATQRRPKVAVEYVSLITGADLTIQIPQAGLRFFTGGVASNNLIALGLKDANVAPTAPAGFRPNRILATIADASPQTETSRASGRSYIRYARGTRGSNTQNTFSVAFQDPGAAPTIAGVRTKFNQLANEKKDEVGGAYGRIWFEIERMPIAESGV